jgi:hypothetical protein
MIDNIKFGLFHVFSCHKGNHIHLITFVIDSVTTWHFQFSINIEIHG